MTYKEAKEALEKTEGNVVEAIISIEEVIDEQSSTKKIGAQGEQVVSRVKEVVRKGNVSKIVVRRGDDTLLNIPLNVGVLGAVVAPWGIIIGVLAAFSFKCQIELVKDSGEVVSITDKAGNLYDEAKIKGGEALDTFKEKAPGVYETARQKGEVVYEKAKDVAEKAQGTAKDAVDKIKSKKEGGDDVDLDLTEELDVKITEPEEDRPVDTEKLVDEALKEAEITREETAEVIHDRIEEKKQAIEARAEEAEAKAEEKIEEAKENIKKKIEEAGEEKTAEAEELQKEVKEEIDRFKFF